MPETSPMNPDGLDPLEQQLRGLTPRPAAIDRDRLMFEAGRVAAGRNLTLWRGAAAAALCLALGLGMWSSLRSDEQMVERIVYVPAAAPVTPEVDQPALPPDVAPKLLADSAWSLRQLALLEGIDALPPPPPVPISRLPLGDLTN